MKLAIQSGTADFKFGNSFVSHLEVFVISKSKCVNHLFSKYSRKHTSRLTSQISQL